MRIIRQRTPDWEAARLGKATASRIADVIATTRSSGYAASRANYAAQLISERLTGVKGEAFESAAMRWGQEKEAEALEVYAFEEDADVAQVGFLDHPTIAMAGASPDGLVSDDGLVEIKCPLTATHIETLLGQAPPSRYLAQMQWQMAVTGRAWCDFVSYDPRLPREMRLFIRRIERNDHLIKDLEREVERFLREIDQVIGKLESLRSDAEAA
jgi:putative phage-type endonuclease